MKPRTLAWTAAATAATAALGGAATEPRSAWYLRLRKPDWQPPAAVFPVIWTALYADIAVTSAVALDRAAAIDSAAALDRSGNDDDGGAGPGAAGRRRELLSYQRALSLNLVLNTAWSWFFWRSRKPWLAAAEAGLLAASSADLVRRTHRLNRAAGVSLAPYAAWCGFATVLSAAIAGLNAPRKG